jgi:phosphate transport system permease protein
LGNRDDSPTATIAETRSPAALTRSELLLTKRSRRFRRLGSLLGEGLLFAIASVSTVAVLFIFIFIFKDALPFFTLRGFKEFFTSIAWYPSADPPEFGALAMFIGSGLVTLGAVVVAVPMGVSAAVCLSFVLPFAVRQVVKPVIEILAAIPSVAYGFFALVVFAPLLQTRGPGLLSVAIWLVGVPIILLGAVVAGGLVSRRVSGRFLLAGRTATIVAIVGPGLWLLYRLSGGIRGVEVTSGTNALNVSIILGIMALPTIVSVSEDALQAVGRELREGSYALGATRAETVLRVVIPAAGSGILAAVILGVMRAVGETMVVWMASGNAAQIPEPWFNYLEPVRTLTATIAGDMGEADHVTGSARYHVLFAMALCLLAISFVANLASELVMRRTRRMLGGE